MDVINPDLKELLLPSVEKLYMRLPLLRYEGITTATICGMPPWTSKIMEQCNKGIKTKTLKLILTHKDEYEPLTEFIDYTLKEITEGLNQISVRGFVIPEKHLDIGVNEIASADKIDPTPKIFEKPENWDSLGFIPVFGRNKFKERVPNAKYHFKFEV